MLQHKNVRLEDAQIKLDESGAGKFAGYASVFGGVDSYNDTILRGAYEHTLRTHGKPAMFFNHDMTMPIGRWTKAKEDEHGLYVEGELTPQHSLASDVHAALKHGTLTGLSIGYFLKQSDYDTTDDGKRIIKRISRLLEVSAVTFPADDAARVDLSSVKAEWGDTLEYIRTERDFERALRDAGVGSKGLAAALVSRARAVFALRDAAHDTAEAKAEEAKAIEAILAASLRF